MKDNPYVGPRPYEPQDRHNFFGREREARELRALIVSEREALFYAQSGAGKTSLLNARVIPALEEEGFLVLPLARVGSELPPGIDADAVDNVFVFSALLALAGKDVDSRALLGHTLRSFLADCCPVEGDTVDSRPVVLILDQFEEVFTTHRARWQDAEGFFRQVREALDALPELGVVLVMREDHLAALDPYAPLFPRRLRARFRMERLGPQGALAAVRRPAENVGCRYDAGVAERLVDDLRRSKVQRHTGEETVLGPFVEPVQLQVVCSQLWDNLPEQEDRTIQWEEVERYGNVDRALIGFYESAVVATCQLLADGTADDLAGPPVTERQLRRWFGEQLITPMGTRDLVLRGPEETATLPNAAVDALESQHIIRADARAGRRWYELAHDRLVEPVLESNRSWEAARETPLRAAARRWEETGDAMLLYIGAALREAAAWAGAHPGEVEPYETEFLAASQQAEQARLRRQRWLLVGAAVGLAVLVAMALLTFFAITGRQEADRQRHAAEVAVVTSEAAKEEAERQRDKAATAEAAQEARRLEAEQARAEAERQAGFATSRELAAAAIANLQRDPQLSVLLALEAISTTYGSEGRILFEAEDALYQALSLSPEILMLEEETTDPWGFTNDFNSVAFSPDGQQIVTGMENATVVVWDAETGQRARTLSAGAAVRSVAYSPTGIQIAAGDWDSSVYLWNAATYAGEGRLEGHTGAVSSVDYSPDGKWLATASWDGTVRLWDVQAKEPLQILAGHGSIVESVAFSPDGKRLVTASRDETARVWDAETGQLSAILPHASIVGDASYSPDGDWIVTASWDGSLRIWQAQTGQMIELWQGHTEGVNSAEYSPDGKWIVTAGGEGTASIWNAQTAQLTRTLQGHRQDIRQAVYSPDGRHIMTVSIDGTARMWRAQLEGLLAFAEAEVDHREFTCEERQKYLHETWFCPTPFPATPTRSPTRTPAPAPAETPSPATTPAPTSAKVRIWVLDNADQEYRFPPYDDTLTFVDSAGKIRAVLTGFNIVQTVGDCRALAASPDGDFVVVAENAGDRVSKYDTQGALHWSITYPEDEVGIDSVDISDNGDVYALTNEGTIYGYSILRLDSETGSILREVEVGGFDIVVDDLHDAIWLVGADIKKLKRDLELELVFDPIRWVAISVDFTSDGSIWVTERDPNRLLKIAPDGTIVHSVGLYQSPGTVRVDRNEDSVWVLVGQVPHKYDAAGNEILRLDADLIGSIAVDQEDGTLWAAGYGELIQYSSDGQELMYIPTDFSSDQKYIALP